MIGEQINETWAPEAADYGTTGLAMPMTRRKEVGNLGDVIEYLERRKAETKPPTEEELKKLRARQKAQGIISGISDAVISVANLVSTHNYAPSIQNASNGMSARAKERFEKEKAEREADEDRWLNYALTIGKLKDAEDAKREKREQNSMSLQLKINEDARRQAKAEHDAEMSEIDLKIKMGKLDYEAARTEKAKSDAKLAAAYAEHSDELVMSKIDSNNRANLGGGSGRPKEYIVKFSDGHVEHFSSEQSARNNAATRGGTYMTTPVTTTKSTSKKDDFGTSETQTTNTRDVSTPAPWSLKDSKAQTTNTRDASTPTPWSLKDN